MAVGDEALRWRLGRVAAHVALLLRVRCRGVRHRLGHQHARRALQGARRDHTSLVALVGGGGPEDQQQPNEQVKVVVHVGVGCDHVLVTSVSIYVSREAVPEQRRDAADEGVEERDGEDVREDRAAEDQQRAEAVHAAQAHRLGRLARHVERHARD